MGTAGLMSPKLSSCTQKYQRAFRIVVLDALTALRDFKPCTVFSSPGFTLFVETTVRRRCPQRPAEAHLQVLGPWPGKLMWSDFKVRSWYLPAVESTCTQAVYNCRIKT